MLATAAAAAVVLPGVSCASSTHKDSSAACVHNFAKILLEPFADMFVL